MSDIYAKLSEITDTVTGEDMSIHTTFKAGESGRLLCCSS